MISTSVNANIVSDVKLIKECTDNDTRDLYINNVIEQYGNMGVMEFVRLNGELIKNKIRLKLAVHPKAWTFTMKYAEDMLELRRSTVYERLHNGILEG